MSLELEVREEDRRRARVREALVRAVEARRTPSDGAYERRVDANIRAAGALADDAVGPPPRRTDQARREQWGQAWARLFHREMDRICAARGIRRQSHQGRGDA